MNYDRVIPRDLFNEAKLLKCVGRLCLLIEDHKAPEDLQYEHNGDPFHITLSEEGNLNISNILFTIQYRRVEIFTTYNSKENYPLYARGDNFEDVEVFDDGGEFTKEFLTFVTMLTPA